MAAAGTPRWGAVFALTLCVATLIASEFMPVSLLTPIATDLDTTEGGAGQAIAVSGIFAVLTSLGISSRVGVPACASLRCRPPVRRESRTRSSPYMPAKP